MINVFLNLEKPPLFSSEIKTEYVKINYYDFNISQDGAFETNSNCRFYVMLSGEIDVYPYSKNKITFNQNQFIIVQPNSKFDITIKKDTKLFCFDINERLVSDISYKLSFDTNSINSLLMSCKLYMNDLSQNMTLSMLNIVNTYFSSDEDKSLLLDIYIQELIYHTFKKLNLSLDTI